MVRQIPDISALTPFPLSVHTARLFLSNNSGEEIVFIEVARFEHSAC